MNFPLRTQTDAIWKLLSAFRDEGHVPLGTGKVVGQ